MGFTQKDWISEADHAGPAASPPGTPISGASLEDLEIRVTDYVDLRGPFVDVVQDGGATGDGIEDDTAEIQAAIDALPDDGGVVWFPANYYKVSSTLTLPSFTTLMGPGSGGRAAEFGINPATASASIVAGAGMNVPILKNDDTVNGNVSISIKSLRLHAPGTDDSYAIFFDKVRRSLIDDIYIYGADTTSRIGIQISNSEIIRVGRSWLEGCGLATGGPSGAVYIDDCEFTSGGIYLYGGAGHWVRDCILYQDGVAAGVDFEEWRYGIFLRGVSRTNVIGCDINAYRRAGILVGSSDRCKLIGNTMIDNSQLTANTWSGIQIDDGDASTANENIIADNHCYDTGSNTQKYGIHLTSDGTVDYNLIHGNNLRGNVSGGYQDDSAESNNTSANNLT